MTEYQFHEIANEFPMHSPKLLQDLTEGVRRSGFRPEFPVVLHESQILDGRNRYLAAKEAGVEPVFVEFSGGDPVEFVIQSNANRRDLEPGQRVAILLHLRKKYPTGSASEAYNSVSNDKVDSRKELAAIAGVSEGTVAQVDYVAKHAPELFEDVKSGKMSANAAYKEAKPHVSHNSGENEWYTPKKFVDAAKAVMGEIDLDPASSEKANETVKAKKFYSLQDDGLSIAWTGRVWMNPPYSSGLIKQFISKYTSHVQSGEITEGIVLVNNATETAWFKQLVSASTAVVFPTGRIKYNDKTGKTAHTPLQGQALLYFGKAVDKFASEFSQFGWMAKV